MSLEGSFWTHKKKTGIPPYEVVADSDASASATAVSVCATATPAANTGPLPKVGSQVPA